MGKELFKNNKFKLAVEEIIEEKKIIDAFTTNANGRPHSKSYQEYLDYYTYINIYIYISVACIYYENNVCI